MKASEIIVNLGLMIAHFEDEREKALRDRNGTYDYEYKNLTTKINQIDSFVETLDIVSERILK